MDKITTRLSLLVLISLLVSACGGGGTDDHMVARGDFPIVFAARSAQALAEPTDVVRFAPGGDLIMLEAASPSAERHNLTRRYTQGRGDVADPEVSYDGRRVVFSMRGPDDETWNIWEYDFDSDSLSRVIADDVLANEGDDLDPHYLPDGRIVFTSNRQTGFRAGLEEAGIEDYRRLDRAARKAAYVLHVVDTNGSTIEQISYTPSHDLNPTVLSSGELLYSRWDVAGDRGEIPVYRARPDGSAMGVYYGAYSEGDSFLHAREMEDGRLVATAVSLRQRAEGGALMVIDAQRYVDQNRAIGSSGSNPGGQHQPSAHQLPLGDGISPQGRFTTPYPLWDGTGRMLVSWSAYQPRDGGNPLVDTDYDAEGAPRYGVYMFDPRNGRQRPIALPDSGTVYVDPVALMPRPRPPVLNDTSNAAGALATASNSPYLALAASDNTAQPAGAETPCEEAGDIKVGPRPTLPDPCDGDGTPGGEDPGEDPGDGSGGDEDGGVQPMPEPPEPNRPMAVLNIKSVYDTDFTDLMGERALLDNESIPRTADGRPDLRALRDGNYGSRPARFLRISEAVPLPPGLGLDMVGATSFKMKRIVGYAPVEPDGSVLVQVPADTPLALAVVDADGRALQTYLDWIQLRPGEERICAGVDCQTTDRRPPLNQGHPTGGAFENSNAAYSAQPGETMAETRARVSEIGVQPANEHMVYDDVWTNGGWDRNVSYGDLAGATPQRGYINYPEHIQPIWDSTCASCHNSGSLNLSGGASNSLGRLASYDALVLGSVVPGAEMEGHDGRRVLQRERPLVEVGGAADSSRSSRLMQALYQLDIHDGLLNSSERRLIAEWIDLGAQYYNSPWDAGADEDELWELAELRNHALPDRAQFSSEIHPILMQECASCHRVHGRSGEPDDLGLYNGGHAPNRFMLSGDPEGNYHMASAFAFAGESCNADASPLLQRARGTESSTPPHPTVEAEDGSRHPVLQPGDASYTRLLEWVAGGCR